MPIESTRQSKLICSAAGSGSTAQVHGVAAITKAAGFCDLYPRGVGVWRSADAVGRARGGVREVRLVKWSAQAAVGRRRAARLRRIEALPAERTSLSTASLHVALPRPEDSGKGPAQAVCAPRLQSSCGKSSAGRRCHHRNRGEPPQKKSNVKAHHWAGRVGVDGAAGSWHRVLRRAVPLDRHLYRSIVDPTIGQRCLQCHSSCAR